MVAGRPLLVLPNDLLAVCVSALLPGKRELVQDGGQVLAKETPQLRLDLLLQVARHAWNAVKGGRDADGVEGVVAEEDGAALGLRGDQDDDAGEADVREADGEGDGEGRGGALHGGARKGGQRLEVGVEGVGLHFGLQHHASIPCVRQLEHGAQSVAGQVADLDNLQAGGRAAHVQAADPDGVCQHGGLAPFVQRCLQQAASMGVEGWRELVPGEAKGHLVKSGQIDMWWSGETRTGRVAQGRGRAAAGQCSGRVRRQHRISRETGDRDRQDTGRQTGEGGHHDKDKDKDGVSEEESKLTQESRARVPAALPGRQWAAHLDAHQQEPVDGLPLLRPLHRRPDRRPLRPHPPCSGQEVM